MSRIELFQHWVGVVSEKHFKLKMDVYRLDLIHAELSEFLRGRQEAGELPEDLDTTFRVEANAPARTVEIVPGDELKKWLRGEL